MTATPFLRSWPGRTAVVAAVALAAGGLTLLPGASPQARAAGLVAWPDCDAMLDHYRGELLEVATAYGVGNPSGSVRLDAARSSAGSGAAESAGGPAPIAMPLTSSVAGDSETVSEAVGSGPTGTNLQERGVDEPDTAKTAGGLLYVVANGRLQVLRAGEQPELLSSTPLGSGALGAELLVDGDRVLALVTGFGPGTGEPVPLPEPEPLPVEPIEPPVEPGVPPVEPPLPLPIDPGVPLPEPLPDDVEPAPVPDGTEPGPAGDIEPAPPVVGGATSDSGSAGGGSRSGTGTGSAPSEDAVVASPPVGDMAMIAPAGDPVVSLVLVDVADPASPQVLETLELDGRYVSARLVDGTVRLVTASSPRLPGVLPVEPYGPAQEQSALEQNRAAVQLLTLEQVLPQTDRRDASGAPLPAGSTLDCADVRHAAEQPQGTSTLTVTTLRPQQGLAAVDSTAVTTDGDLVYASTDRLYVATSRWGTVTPTGTTRSIAPAGEVATELHAFDTSSPDRTRYLGSGAVPGYVYGRWALSAHEGHLRVATTLEPPWDGSGQSSSSLFVLAERGDGLVETGRVDGLGVDERIFAVRYFGDLATVVTFRQTDPLYVLDLADPSSPKVLGELKIPGFSTYLHPVGDGHLLGVGQDADARGQVTGMQLSLFDLTDLSKPAQVDRLSLGQGWSPAGEDSRAFGYDPTQRLAVLPFSSYDPQRSSALGVRVTDDFRLAEVGRLDVGAASQVERALVVDGVVHAVTPEGVVAGSTSSFARTGTAAFVLG